MAKQPVDVFARFVAGGYPRRTILGALGAWIIGLRPEPAAAACKRVNKPCDRNRDCCDHAHCPAKKCRCRDGFKNCDGTCHDLDTSDRHCGGCNRACPAGETCCDGECVDIKSDEDNCGACGHRCEGVGVVCSQRECICCI